MAVSDERLEQIVALAALEVPTFPRVYLEALGWSTALIEDYDIKGQAIQDLLNAVRDLAQAELDRRANP